MARRWPSGAAWCHGSSRPRRCRALDDAVLFQYVQLYAETEALAADQARTAELIDRLDSEIDALPQNERGSLISDLIKLKQIEARYPNQIRQGRMALRQFLVELGMTPAARGRVKPTMPDDKKALSPLALLQARAALRQVK